MPATFASLGLGGMTAEEKLELVGNLWDDLFASSPPGSLLGAAQRDDLLRRQADAIASPNDWISWDEVRAATLRRLQG